MIFNKLALKKQAEDTKKIKNFDSLLEEIKKDFMQLLRVNLNIGPLMKRERDIRIRKRENLRVALRNCGFGNIQAKILIKNHIMKLLSDKYKITEENIEFFLKEDSEYKFKVILGKFSAKYKNFALEKLIETYFSHIIKSDNREISVSDINRAYFRLQHSTLSYPEKMEILCQRIYEKYKGNGVVDEIIPLTIDGISGGVSNNNGELYPWIMYRGNTLSLSFLKFDGEQEIKRICRNLCKSYGMGQLSERKGYIVAELKDGSRASISRPPFCESWSFFIRKFRMEETLEIEDLIMGYSSDKVIKLIEYLIRAERLIAVTGEQGVGKTTLLAAIIKFIPEWLNIRVSEMSFELHLRKRFPRRNILSFRETDSIGVQEGLDFTKKTDGNVTILGEVATMQAVIFLVQVAQNASAFTLFTHHAKDTLSLIQYIRNSLLLQGNFRNEDVALLQAVRTVQFNIHLAKNSLGERYIEKISEIVPNSLENGFDERDIVHRKGNGYVFRDELSRETIERIYETVPEEEKSDFLNFLRWSRENGKATF